LAQFITDTMLSDALTGIAWGAEWMPSRRLFIQAGRNDCAYQRSCL